MTRYFQFSIRELIAVVTFGVLAVVGLTKGAIFASVAGSVAVVLTSAAIIVSLVGRNELRAYAVGFVVPAIAYTSIVLAAGDAEWDPYHGRLPTTQLIKAVFQFVVKEECVNRHTGKPIPNYTPDVSDFVGKYGAQVRWQETPDRTTFTVLAHILFAMTFGFGGAKFATYVYSKQD